MSRSRQSVDIAAKLHRNLIIKDLSFLSFLPRIEVQFMFVLGSVLSQRLIVDDFRCCVKIFILGLFGAGDKNAGSPHKTRRKNKAHVFLDEKRPSNTMFFPRTSTSFSALTVGAKLRTAGGMKLLCANMVNGKYWKGRC